jgi:hypothetical protein
VSARYLLRFDDLCPTMDLQRWLRFERLIERFGLKPILAVVPQNEDLDLVCGPADDGFWERMRRLEAAGVTIGLHGFRHVCEGVGGGLIPLHGRTEFAGVAKDLQLEWMRAGLAILRGHGLDPQIWVAPRHGLDRVTLEVLREAGIGLISDGFACAPFLDEGLVWIPMQLWRPMEKSGGVWTICLHANTASDADVARLETFLERFAGQFRSVREAVAEWPLRPRGWRDRVFRTRMLGRIWIKRAVKRGGKFFIQS